MSGERVAVLGGDVREAYIAGQLRTHGYDVAVYGAALDGQSGGAIVPSDSPQDAVRGARWIVCPSPGLGDGDVVYAPSSPTRIVLDSTLLSPSDAAAGGLVIGRATEGVRATCDALGIPVFEMKDDRSLAASNARSVAEALVAILVGKTVRILPEHQILVVGFGATGKAFTKALIGLSCEVTVAARRDDALAEAEAMGARAVPFGERVDAMSNADIVVNTVPSFDAVPPEAYAVLQDALVVDIASPPGGLDHEAARSAGVNVTWARGLAGGRAPHSAGDAQLAFILRSVASRAAAPEQAAAATQ